MIKSARRLNPIILPLLLIAILSAGCKTTEAGKDVQPAPPPAQTVAAPTPAPANVARSTFDEDCRQLQQFIRSEYHQPGVKEIFVVLKEDNRTAYKDKVLADFILSRMKKCLSEGGGIKLLPAGDSRMAAVVSLYVVPDFREDFQVLVTLIDARSRAIVYAQSSFRNPGDFNNQALAEYRNSYESTQNAENAYLVLKGISKGEAIKEKDQYVEEMKWGSVGGGQYSQNSGSFGHAAGGEYFQGVKKGGFSSWYPAEQMCVVNGQDYELSPDDIFYKGRVAAGKVRITCSFREGYYNADTRSQTASKLHEKSIVLDLPKAQRALVEVVMHFDGSDEGEVPDITFKVKKLPPVEEY